MMSIPTGKMPLSIKQNEYPDIIIHNDNYNCVQIEQLTASSGMDLISIQRDSIDVLIFLLQRCKKYGNFKIEKIESKIVS